MVKDDAEMPRNWARGKGGNKLELRLTASMKWCRGKNIPAIHTLISDDDSLMKIKDDHAGDNYVDENNEVEDVAICAAGFPPLRILKANAVAGAIWSLMVCYRVIFFSGHAPSFIMVPNYPISLLQVPFVQFFLAFQHLSLALHRPFS